MRTRLGAGIMDSFSCLMNWLTRFFRLLPLRLRVLFGSVSSTLSFLLYDMSDEFAKYVLLIDAKINRTVFGYLRCCVPVKRYKVVLLPELHLFSYSKNSPSILRLFFILFLKFRLNYF